MIPQFTVDSIFEISVVRRFPPGMSTDDTHGLEA